jgi:hypothetical protein
MQVRSRPVGATTYRRVIGDDSFASDEPIDRQRPPELERPLPATSYGLQLDLVR